MQNYNNMYLIQRECSTNETISDCAYTHWLQACVAAVSKGKLGPPQNVEEML